MPTITLATASRIPHLAISTRSANTASDPALDDRKAAAGSAPSGRKQGCGILGRSRRHRCLGILAGYRYGAPSDLIARVADETGAAPLAGNSSVNARIAHKIPVRAG